MRPPRPLICASLLLGLLAGSGCARRNFFQPDARLTTEPLPAGTETVRATPGRHYQRGVLHRMLFGAHYRRVWATPVTVPVFNLQTAEKTGLKPGKIGGGFQTTSMTLLGPNDREFALRTLDKDPYKTLPKVMQKTFLLTWVRDVTSAGMPYAAFVVPPLAEAAGVRHSTPELFYIRPDENGLGEASERFRGKMVMLEEKLEGEEVPAPNGRKYEIQETEDILEELYAKPTGAIAQRPFARARLLDLWLGDWDRHEGQWTWEHRNNGQLYVAIPKDRDQVFFRFDDGILPWIGSRFVKKFRTFKPRYENIEGYTRNARFLDERALNQVTRQQMQAEARSLQQQLSDSVIAQALRRLPPEVYALEGPRLASALRARREKLPAAADTYYRILAKEVLVPGTDEAERFVVERQSDTATVVSVYALADDDKPEEGRLRYRRVFHPSETERVVLHGLGGKDLFEVRGKVRRSPRIDVYGGPHEDTLKDSSRVAGLGKKTRFYDTKRNNVFEPGAETKDARSRGVASYAFDRDGSGR
ncbi:hypothetical protein [Hymenobacter koreensis]|uniref:GWxTD domain-containing protein n=1 Tax=Hymenobacter koreensis TaxID=1084523 RepID=A0ABP8J803_9BACT